MVLIEKTRVIESSKGEFCVLDLVSQEPSVKVSKNTGKPYLVLMRASISCTFSKDVAETLVGKTLPGKILKVKVPAYEFSNPTTGEVMVLNHSNRYFPEIQTEEEAVFNS